MDPSPIESLTRCETEVLQLLDARLSTQEIAAVLHISPATVKRHARSIYRKLAARLLSSDALEDEPSGESPPWAPPAAMR